MPKKLIESASVATVLRNMTVLAAGAGGAKLISLLAVPVITRIYSPSDMGVLAVFTAVTTILIPICSLRYAVALPLPRSEKSAANLAALCLFLLLSTSCVLIALFFFLGDFLFELAGVRELSSVWMLVVLVVFAAGFYEILSQWSIREKAFRPLARSQVWQSLGGAATKIGLGLLGVKPLGLLLGQLVSQGGGASSLFAILFRALRRNSKQITKFRAKLVAKVYVGYPKYRLPSQFLLVFSSQSPLLFGAALFGADVAGQLGLALMVIALPVSIIGKTASQSFYSEASRIGKSNPGTLRAVTKTLSLRLALVGSLPCAGLLLFGPVAFEFFFGDPWRDAGLYASALSAYLLMQLIFSPITNVLSVVRKDWYFLQINIVRTMIVLLAFYASHRLSMTPFSTIVLYSASMVVHRIFVFYRVLHMLKVLPT